MALDELNDAEQPLEVNEIKVLMDNQVKPFAAGQVIDYIQNAGGEGFAISPEMGDSCG